MLEIDRSEWLASQFLKETMGSPISRPRQVANTRPLHRKSVPFCPSGLLLQDCIPRPRTHRALGSQSIGCAAAHQSPIRIKALDIAQ